jgi:hypothetical protein
VKNASILQVEDNPAVERLSGDLYNMFQALSQAFHGAAQHSVQLTVGTHRVILTFFAAWSVSRFDRESPAHRK